MSTQSVPSWMSPEMYHRLRQLWQHGREREQRQHQLAVHASDDPDDVLPIPTIDYTQPSGLERRVPPPLTLNADCRSDGSEYAEQWAKAEPLD